MAVPDWPPTRIMQDLANESYKAKSGNNVKLEADFIPWPNYYERLAASLTSGEQKYQMVVSDSQWLGAFVEGGYYMKINEFIDADPELQAIFADLHPQPGRGVLDLSAQVRQLLRLPADAGRADRLLSDRPVLRREASRPPTRKSTARSCPAIPPRWTTSTGTRSRRSASSSAAPRAISWPGRRSTTTSTASPISRARPTTSTSCRSTPSSGSTAPTSGTRPRRRKARRKAWSTRTRRSQALEHYLSLLEYMPPVVKTGTMDIFKVDELFREGKVAWIIQWIGFAESAITPATSKVADKIAFAVHPGLREADGKISRWANIGGQPFVMTTWNDDEMVGEMVDYVKWWLSPEIQTEFARRGGQSGRQSVFNQPDYVEFRPWNRTWASSLDWQKDVWHVPSFFELLVQSQEEYDKAITGQQSAKQALDNIAAFQQNLLEEEGLID